MVWCSVKKKKQGNVAFNYYLLPPANIITAYIFNSIAVLSDNLVIVNSRLYSKAKLKFKRDKQSSYFRLY